MVQVRSFLQTVAGDKRFDGCVRQTFQVYARMSAEDVYKRLAAHGTAYVIVEESICSDVQLRTGCRVKDLLDAANGQVSPAAGPAWPAATPPGAHRLRVLTRSGGPVPDGLLLQARPLLPGGQDELLPLHQLLHPGVLEPLVPRLQGEPRHLLPVLTGSGLCSTADGHMVAEEALWS